MPYEIVMPQLGLTMTEGAVNTWLKQPGERVEKGEMLFSVSTDKVDMEVESTGTGFLSTLVGVGQTIPVGTVIAVLTEQPAESAGESPNGSVKYPASPRARALAKSLGIEIGEITPKSGTRIVEEDVKQYHANRPAPTVAPISSVKRITAQRTAESFERAPHFYLGAEVNAGKLVVLRSELGEIAERRIGFKPTYTDFLLRALAMALGEQPGVNAYWHDRTVQRRDSADVGFAAQTDTGLVVPVIRKADGMSLFAIATKRRDLSERARAGALHPDELQGGSATLSNLGSEGVDWFQAILNPPQSVILASGSLAKRPIVVEDRLEAGYSLMLTLSADHRVLDGVAAARFLMAIKRTLENPQELLL
ncbi:MAG: 2-oxo acid dehydrogenase subunit E2 [Acidobacteriaceae bacterium]|nr:2-oxo acid dehydrogenase subunit E2 [Acidobacteriaceae bacterium]